jgi:hypothetical protein
MRAASVETAVGISGFGLIALLLGRLVSHIANKLFRPMGTPSRTCTGPGSVAPKGFFSIVF